MPRPETTEWGQRYLRVRPTYELFAEKLRLLICDLLASAEVAIVQSEGRGKEVESFVAKIEAKQDQYSDPIDEITDLAGVRVIAYYLEDVETIGELIRHEFEVDIERSIQKGGTFDPDQFGYISDHYIIRMKPPRSELTEWDVFAGMVAELQVRTATQHAWAAVEHRLGYKSARQLPPDLRRRLHRLSALFELADEQFSGVRAAAVALQEQYGETLRQGDLSVPLDISSLVAYMAESDRVKRAMDLFSQAGAVVLTSPDTDDRRIRQDRDRSELLQTLESLASIRQ